MYKVCRNRFQCISHMTVTKQYKLSLDGPRGQKTDATWGQEQAESWQHRSPPGCLGWATILAPNFLAQDEKPCQLHDSQCSKYKKQTKDNEYHPERRLDTLSVELAAVLPGPSSDPASARGRTSPILAGCPTARKGLCLHLLHPLCLHHSHCRGFLPQVLVLCVTLFALSFYK